MKTNAAFFDVDGTLTTDRVWRGMIEYFKQRRLRRWTHRLFWAYHTPLYLLFKMKLIQQTGFREPWAAHLAWYIRGYTVEEAQPIWDWVANEYLTPIWRADALDLIREHKAAGDLVVLVSAGLTPLQEAIAKRVGADLAVGTQPEMRNGRYTGQLSGPVCINEQKAALAKQVVAGRGYEVDYGASVAYADSVTDFHLLEMVGNPVAFHPDDELRPIAQNRHWTILE